MQSRIVTLCSILFLAVSCNLVDISTGESDLFEYTVNLHPEWNMSEEEPNLYIAAARVPDAVHYIYDYPETTSASWLHGHYYVLAFDRNDELYNVNDWYEFAAEASVSMRDISVSLKEYEGKEVQDLLGKGVTDYNPLLSFVGSAGNLCSAFSSKKVGKSESPDIFLTPERLTQDLTVRFKLELLDDVEILKINPVVSGVVGNVSPMTGIVDSESLHKTCLTVEKIAEDGNKFTFEAKGRILGIFPPKSPDTSAGNGILQLILFIRAGDGGKTNVFYAGFNMKNSMSGLEIMKPKEDGFCIASDIVEIVVDDVLQLSSDSIIGTNLADGISQWFDYEIIDVEI